MKILRALGIISKRNIEAIINNQKRLLNEHHERVYKAHHQHTVECLKSYIHDLKEEAA
jgi:hypothetical protein